MDALVLEVADKTKCEYKIVRTMTDIMLFILGILMGDKFGIEPIIVALIIGTTINTFVKIFKGY